MGVLAMPEDPDDLAVTTPATAVEWPDQIYRVFKSFDVRQVAFVPDAGHAQLIERCQADPAIHAVSLTTEEEGVALAAGAWLGGHRAVLLMQSSGVGNCINMLSLIQECRIPLLTVVTMRGDWGEANPWQVAMGQGTPAALRNAGVIVETVDDAASVADTVRAAAQFAFSSHRAVAVLIRQRVIGAKTWVRG
jgi:sulfopyruvate decarboxylase alpha subunit